MKRVTLDDQAELFREVLETWFRLNNAEDICHRLESNPNKNSTAIDAGHEFEEAFNKFISNARIDEIVDLKYRIQDLERDENN
jgi:hypothetical protein